MGLIRVLFLGGMLLVGALWLRKMLKRKSLEQAIPTAESGVIRKITHHDNGRMASERYLMDGVMHGPYMLWDRGGNKIAEGEYRNGMLHGMERRFGPDDKLIGEVRWEEGRRIATRKEGADGEVIELRLVHEDGQPVRDQPVEDPTEKT